MDLVLLAVGAIFVNNILLAQFLGNCPFLGTSKKMETALGMSMAVIFVLVLAGSLPADLVESEEPDGTAGQRRGHVLHRQAAGFEQRDLVLGFAARLDAGQHLGRRATRFRFGPDRRPVG